MRILALIMMTLLLSTDLAVAATGRVTGGRAHVLPDWFKQSFLNIKEDAEELGASGKHLMIFVDLNDCPYCARTLDENFHGGPNTDYIRKHFDVVALNFQGDREVTWLDGKIYREAQMPSVLRILGTPTLLFIDRNGKQILKFMGYHQPDVFRAALEYVNSQSYQKQTLAQFIESRSKKPVYEFRPHPRFQEITDFSREKGPLLIIFEDRNCTDCASFHDKALNHPDVLAELKPFRVARIDASAESSIVDVDGKKTTPRKWAAALKVNNRPSLVLFDEGRKVTQTDGRLFHFHTKELLRFVSGKYYKRYDRFGLYVADRQAELIRSGKNIDFGE